VPTTTNFSGKVRQSADPATEPQASSSAAQWKQVGISLGVGIATMPLGTAIIEVIKWRIKVASDASAANKRALQDAEQRAQERQADGDEVSRETTQAEENVQSDPDPGSLEPPPGENGGAGGGGGGDPPVTTDTTTDTVSMSSYAD